MLNKIFPGVRRHPDGARLRPCGFTMVELVAVIAIAGILAALVLPRFVDSGAFDRRGFYDQVISTLRYAQKAAIAQRRFVCVAFGANSVTLTYGTTAACGSNLAGLDGKTPYTISSSNASFSPVPAAFYFDTLGRNPGAKQTLSIVNVASPIYVETETGYVH